MIVLSANTAAAIALHAAESSWVVFLQVFPSNVRQGPIKIEGIKGSQLAMRLMSIVRECPYEIRLIGLIPTTIPYEHAEAIGAENELIHDGWYQPSSELIAVIDSSAQDSIQALLDELQPGALDVQDVVDITGIAEILNVSVPTIRRMIDKRKIPFMRFGQSYRFSTKDVLASVPRR